MWYLRFRLKHKGCIYTPYTKKFGITDHMYLLGHSWKKQKDLLLTSIHVLHGPEKGIKKYTEYLKKHPDVKYIEGYGNIIFTQVKQEVFPEEYQAVYNPEILYIAPVINDKEGYELWQIASWKRAPLAHLISLSKTSPIVIDFELLELRKKVIHDVYIANLLPKLPPKQIEALRIAQEAGYYNFPKTTDLSNLAKKMKVTKATFQEHLKKAESKIIPFMLQQRKI